MSTQAAFNTESFKTVFGTLSHYTKGSIELVSGKKSHYAFSNIFEVASQSAPYEKVVVGLNLGYVIETLRAEGTSPWFTCAHDEFVISVDGSVRVDFLTLDTPPMQVDGTQLAGELPKGRPMGYVLLKRGHQALLPAGYAYRFDASTPCVLLQQTVQGALSVEKWADICLK